MWLGRVAHVAPSCFDPSTLFIFYSSFCFFLFSEVRQTLDQIDSFLSAEFGEIHLTDLTLSFWNDMFSFPSIRPTLTPSSKITFTTLSAAQMVHPDIAQALLQWTLQMEENRDGERGEGEGGAHQWLLEKMSLSGEDLNEDFVGVTDNGDVVWQGHTVADDRDSKRRFQQTFGLNVDVFWGLLNTKYEERGRGIGWAGAQMMDEWLQRRVCQSCRPHVIAALYTDNAAAERHYVSLGYSLLGNLEIVTPRGREGVRAYSKTYLGAPPCF